MEILFEIIIIIGLKYLLVFCADLTLYPKQLKRGERKFRQDPGFVSNKPLA